MYKNSYTKNEINKENLTPSNSILSSAGQMLRGYEQNTKGIANKKQELINTLEITEERSIQALNRKEELAYDVVIKDNQIFKEKAELDYLDMICKGIENQNNMHEENTKMKNYQQLNLFLSNLYEDDYSHNQSKIKFKNNFYVAYSKTQKEQYSLTGIYNEGPNIGNLNDILEKNVNTDPDLMIYYANFNII